MNYFSKIKIKDRAKGFTLVETMVSIALFLIIVTAGMSALLNASALQQKSQDMRSIMDNLSFIMEEMSRNLRTGYDYHCFTSSEIIPSNPTPLVSTPKSCTNGWAISFENSFGDKKVDSDQWVYKIESQDSGKTFNIYKSVDGGASFIQLNPSEIVLKSFSGFSVLGAEGLLTGDQQQPFVNIRLDGTITYKNIITPFALQSSV